MSVAISASETGLTAGHWQRAFLGLLAELPSFSRRILEAMAVRLRREDLGTEGPLS